LIERSFYIRADLGYDLWAKVTILLVGLLKKCLDLNVGVESVVVYRVDDHLV
jgi:hypothetical protein